MNTPIPIDAFALFLQRRAFVFRLCRQLTTIPMFGNMTSMYRPYVDKRKRKNPIQKAMQLQREYNALVSLSMESMIR